MREPRHQRAVMPEVFDPQHVRVGLGHSNFINENAPAIDLAERVRYGLLVARTLS